MNKAKFTRLIPALAIIMLMMQAACRRQEPAGNDTEVTRIRVVQTSNERMILPVNASGYVVPAKEIRLAFKTGGIIKELYVNDGSRVKKGALLATLDMAEINAQVQQAENGYDKALRDYTRARNLYTDSVATLEQFQNAETALNVAKAMKDAAVFNREHSKIIAPEDGVILRRLVQVHEVVAPGYPVFLFGTTGTHWKIKAGLSDRDFVRVTYSDSAVVIFDAYPQKKFEAFVSRISESANPMTGTYEIELDLLPAAERLASGFIANIGIVPSKSPSYISIPVEALVDAEGRTGYVFVVDDSSKAKKVKVEIAEVSGALVAVSSGLEGNELIATEGSAYLNDGDKIEIVR